MSPRSVGRYLVYEAFAAGGMASVHLGRLKGQAGFARTVAVKQLHPSFAEDPATVSTILDEARIASRIQHPNVVSTLDVVVEGADILLVLEYVHGDSFARLLRSSAEPPPVPVVLSVVAGMLHGLHAAHEAKAENGEPLGIVHRDVSPQNVLVGVDGLARVLDFGIAKARGRLQTTREGQVKGKLAYMAPEQIRSGEVSRRTDVFAAGIVLWEALTGQRLFAGENEGHVITRVLEAEIAAPSTLAPGIGPDLDAVVLRALDRDPGARFETAREMALVIEAIGPVAAASAVGRWVEASAADVLRERADRVAAIEQPESRGAAAVASRRDEPTRTDAAASVRNEPTRAEAVGARAEVTRTENSAVSLEPAAISKPGSRRIVYGALLLAVLATAGLAATFFRERGGDGSDRESAAAMVTVPSSMPPAPSPSEPAATAVSPSASASASTSASASRVGAPAGRGPARGPARSTPTAAPTATPTAEKPGYYRFE